MTQRGSAHYNEISRIYGNLMLFNYEDEYLKVEFERNQLSDEEKKTKFAVPSYKYVAMKEL